MPSYKNVLAWAQRNERHLGAVVFVTGFITDIFTFGELGLSWVSLLFIGYIVLTGIAIIFTHHSHSQSQLAESTPRRTTRIVAPLVAQFFIGSLLSGTLIFYARSATLFVSWPFLILLIAIFVGNEYFRKYKERLTFQAIQFFLVVYAYTLFAFPFYTHTLTKQTFLYSSLVAVSLSFTFFLILFFVGKKRFLESFTRLFTACTFLTALLIGSYYTGILPPLPLSLKDVGVYHSLERTNGTYVLTQEVSTPWYLPFAPTVMHIQAGEPLYGYSAVFAPGSFSTNLIHAWEKYDVVQKKWIPQSKVAFTLSGGRNDGYRGYSYITNATPGPWRLSVLSESEQVLGRVQFEVQQVDTEPTLETVIK